ncbi:MAG TPA: hypothetical protein VFJ05_05430 [Nitrososphaeraceae archaeon]|nr:hypothetical protein [Nitrososphaeraceae archaeon]
MIRTEAAIITGTCYAQQIAHNEYLSQFFVCNNNNLIYHHISLLSIVVAFVFLIGIKLMIIII